MKDSHYRYLCDCDNWQVLKNHYLIGKKPSPQKSGGLFLLCPSLKIWTRFVGTLWERKIAWNLQNELEWQTKWWQCYLVGVRELDGFRNLALRVDNNSGNRRLDWVKFPLDDGTLMSIRLSKLSRIKSCNNSLASWWRICSLEWLFRKIKSSDRGENMENSSDSTLITDFGDSKLTCCCGLISGSSRFTVLSELIFISIFWRNNKEWFEVWFTMICNCIMKSEWKNKCAKKSFCLLQSQK